ncbi:hypothetical protein SEUCBS139899_010653 [Sporothrix eucalyptigena]
MAPSKRVRIRNVPATNEPAKVSDQVTSTAAEPCAAPSFADRVASAPSSPGKEMIDALPGPSDQALHDAPHAIVSGDALSSQSSASTPTKDKAPDRSLAARRQAEREERERAFPEHCVSLDRRVAWFDDDSVTPTVVSVSGAAAHFTLAPHQSSDGEIKQYKSRTSKGDAAPRPFNNSWMTLLSNMCVFEIDGPGKDLYLCWVLRTSTKQDVFWRGMGPDQNLLQYWVDNQAQLAARAQPVYMERLNGGPLGSIPGSLCDDKRRLKGLFIQMYGYRNTNPCECCERGYRAHISPGPVEDGIGQRPTRVMTPFFECISLPFFSKGSCGNCEALIRNRDCSYHLQPSNKMGPLPSWVPAKRASWLTEQSLPPRKLTLEAAPIRGSDLAAPIVKKHATNAKGRGWMADQAAFGRAIDWEGTIPTSSTGAPDQTVGTFHTTAAKGASTKKGKGKDVVVPSLSVVLNDAREVVTPTKFRGASDRKSALDIEMVDVSLAVEDTIGA